MKALVLNAVGRGFELEDVDLAAPVGREVLVEVRASGLCHTDLLFATHDFVRMPAVLGHELDGVVAAVGPEVTQLRVGDHGLAGFAERALIHENQLAAVPKEVPFAQAALLGCGVVTGAGSVLNTANVSAGDSVVIFGAGGVGLNAISGARIAGASRIVVIDIQAKRLEEARRFGATDVIDSTKTKPVEAVRDLLPGGADHVFDFVGLKAVSEQGLEMLGVGGGLYLVGLARPEIDIALNIMSAIAGQKRVEGVNYGSTNSKRDIPMYAELYLQGRMNLDDLVSKTISLREVNDGYAALKDGSLTRVVVTTF